METKCLVALGVALTVSFVFAMILMQWIAQRLVLETTRLAARHFALSVIENQHIEYFSTTFAAADGSNNASPESSAASVPALQSMLRREFQSSKNSYRLLRLDDTQSWTKLGGQVASSDSDLAAMYRIESKMRPKTANDLNLPNNDQVVDEKNAKVGDVFERFLSQLSGPNFHDAVFEEVGPVDGFYYYYHPIEFSGDCLTCHIQESADPAVTQMTIAANPFRVLRINMPYEDTRIWTIWTYSLMIAVAVATLSIALLLEHRILKRLVIRPLKYLRDITDRVARGETSIRSDIDTRDEFQSLSDSFNDMLRHLIETQTDLEQVNKKLDGKVDDLAQVNLELFEANRMKNEFLANMSHELRTPLNSILGFSDVLANIDSLNEKQKRYAHNIQRSGRVLLDMINDILDLAKIDAGKMQMRCVDLDLAAVVNGQCELIRPMSDEKNIDLRVQSNEFDESKMRMYQDKGKLQQVLNNLLSNAIKFTPEGGLITVSMRLDDPETFSICVQDTGVGIAEHDQEHIFEKFRQVRAKEAPDSLTREVTGTGLGLSITKELCRLMGGEIYVQSDLGKGSTFTVMLPRDSRVGKT